MKLLAMRANTILHIHQFPSPGVAATVVSVEHKNFTENPLREQYTNFLKIKNTFHVIKLH